MQTIAQPGTICCCRSILRLGCHHLIACLQHCFSRLLTLRLLNAYRFGMSPRNIDLKFSSAFDEKLVRKTNRNLTAGQLIKNLI